VRASSLSPFAALVTAPYSKDVLAMTLPLPAATTYTLDQAALSLVGAAGTWNGSNYWNVSLQTRDDSLDLVGRIATATFATHGADIVRLTPDTELQVVDGAVTPYLAIELEPVGSPPNLLASVGSAVLFEADGEELVPVAGPTTTAPTFLSARYSGNALAMVLPLASDHRYTVDSAAINLVGATGTWDASNNWTVSLTSRSASLGVDTVLATGTFSSSGSGTVNLSPTALVDGDDTPALAIAFQKVGNPPMLLAADATVTLDSEQYAPTTYTYDANGNTLTETVPGRALTYTWNGENRLRELVEDGSSEQYTYAATGLRRTKTTSSGTTEFLWDGQNLLAELDEALATLAQYTDWPGRWGGLSSARRSGGSEFLTYDMSANTRLLLSAAEAVQETYTYRAFGPELTELGGDDPFRFGGMVGYYRDGAERVYVRARWYGPECARWWSRDPEPIGLDASRTFGYSANRPTDHLDPSGRKWCCWVNKWCCPPTPGEAVDGILISDDNFSCADPSIAIDIDADQNWMPEYGENPYRRCEYYMGVPAECMFELGGNSPWAQFVRGCLVCMHAAGYSQKTAHQYCYRRATYLKGTAAAEDALDTAVGRAAFCFVFGNTAPVVPPGGPWGGGLIM